MRRDEVRLVVPARLRCLPLVREFVRWSTEDAGIAGECCHRLVLAAIEAVTNVIRHAYGGESDEPIELGISRVEAGGVEIEILDRGRYVPACERRSRALSDLRPGGLGVHLIECSADEVRCEAREGGGSRLVLRKTSVRDVAGSAGAGPKESE